LVDNRFVGVEKSGFLSEYFVPGNVGIKGYDSRNYKYALEAEDTNVKLEELILKNSDTTFIKILDDIISSIWQNIQRFNSKDKVICHVNSFYLQKSFLNINNFGVFRYQFIPCFNFLINISPIKNLKN
jgi:hypothetical protein